MKYKVKVTQVFRVEKDITLDVDADSPEDAVEAVANGEVWIPSAEEGITNSPWGAGRWILQNQEETLA